MAATAAARARLAWRRVRAATAHMDPSAVVMPRRPLRVLVVNTSDSGGGAELTSFDLFQAVRRRGHPATMVVGRKKTAEVNVVALAGDADRNPWARFWIAVGDGLQPLERHIRVGARVRDCVYWASEPIRWIERAFGHED